MSTMYMMIGVAVLVGLTVLVIAFAITSLIAGSSEVDDRLFAYAKNNSPFAGLEESGPDVSDRVNSYLSGRGFAGGIAANLTRAGVKLTVPEYVLLKLTALLLPFAGVMLVTRHIVPGLVVGVVCTLLPDLWLKIRQRRRSSDFIQQLPDTLALIVSGLRAGFSLQQAIVNVGKEAPEPTSLEFSRVAQEIRLGVPLLDALDSLVRRIKSDDLDMIVSVFKIHSRVGGNLATVLDTVSATIRERVRLRREIQVITSMQRYSSYVLGFLPVGMGLVLMVINPGYIMELFHWNILLCIPVGAALMTIMGFMVIRKIADVKI